MKSLDFRVGDIVFSSANKERAWTVLDVSDVGVLLVCTHIRNGDKIGEKLGKYFYANPQWCFNIKILSVANRPSAKVV